VVLVVGINVVLWLGVLLVVQGDDVEELVAAGHGLAGFGVKTVGCSVE